MSARLLVVVVALVGCAPQTAERPAPLHRPPDLGKERTSDCSRQFDAEEAGFQTCITRPTGRGDRRSLRRRGGADSPRE